MSSKLYQNGHRKYLTREERNQFLRAAETADREVRTFCGVLAYSGCRISEALALTVDRVDLSEGLIIFESLKKRRSGVFRTVPVPPQLLDSLNMVHGIRESQKGKDDGKKTKLWTWSRTTAWRRVKAVLQSAELTAPFSATPKGLRHSLGVSAVSNGIPLNLVQRWLGHAQLSTTAMP